MFVYLSKKIAIPNNTRLNCIAWNKDQGYIAVGGDDGLLKVLKLEQATTGTAANASQPNRGGLAAPSNLSMNQTLEGHKAPVQVITWNEIQQKLTTSDRDGVIMVWMLYKGSWYEEMTNDRKKSTVKGMAWTPDGQKICIVYEDGAVIVGSVDGNRIWGKELKNTPLTGVQWSPDGRLLLFSIRSGELHLYDNQGTFVMKLNVQCVNLGPSRSISVVSISWFNQITLNLLNNRPVLAILYENGKMQIMRNENDDLPIIIDTQMQAISCLWNHDGTILGVCGIRNQNIANDKETNQIMFFTPFGVHLRTLKIPGKEITSLSWEGQSLRIALAVDSYIYFANIRPDYLWCYFSKTVVFKLTDNSMQTTNNNQIIVFWDTNTNQTYSKYVDNIIGITSTVDHCCIVIETVKIILKDPNIIIESQFNEQMYQLMICNSISTTVDAKYTDLRPDFVAMNTTHVVIASKNHFLLWNYYTPKGSSTLHHNAKKKQDKRYHIDDTPNGIADVLNDLDKNSNYELPTNTGATKDPICCLSISEKLLIIGRESGILQVYTIPNIALLNRITMVNRAYKISINCNSTRASVIDSNGILTSIDLNDTKMYSSNIISSNNNLNNNNSSNSTNKIERKDVWAMCWARDNPQLLAIMEKTRMYVIRGNDPEEPISCSGYICNFDDLEITGVLLDDIVSGKTVPNSMEHILQLRVKSLRDTEELLQHVGINEAKQFIEDNPHPRLWRLLADASLKKLDLETAESSFVRCNNYPGIQLIKRLLTIQNDNLRMAEISAFFGDFDNAEKLYIDADRRDLAIKLRTTLCDWFRTVQLYRMGPGISDQQMEQAWMEIGHHFANLRSWESAKEYYEKAHYIEGLMEALYYLEKYDELENCINKLSEKNPLLIKLGQMLSSIGMCNQSVKAYLKYGDVKSAVNTCVNLRQWGQAVELAQKYKMPQINILLNKHATYLLKEGRLPEAIELQRKAGRYLDSSRLLIKLAECEIKNNNNYLNIKKLYILAGLLIEDYIKIQIQLTGNKRSIVLSQLQQDDINLIEQIWHNAEAYHFLLLAQRQLLSGLIHNSVLTTIRLCNYDDVLSIEDIYCLLALTSCADRSFGTCSKAFIKLEALEQINELKRIEYEELAVNIFSKYEPTDTRVERIDCFTCESLVPDWCTSCPNCGTNFPACIATGKSLMNPTDAWQCNICQHCANYLDITSRQTCPLCHSAVILKNTIINDID